MHDCCGSSCSHSSGGGSSCSHSWRSCRRWKHSTVVPPSVEAGCGSIRPAPPTPITTPSALTTDGLTLPPAHTADSPVGGASTATVVSPSVEPARGSTQPAPLTPLILPPPALSQLTVVSAAEAMHDYCRCQWWWLLLLSQLMVLSAAQVLQRLCRHRWRRAVARHSQRH